MKSTLPLFIISLNLAIACKSRHRPEQGTSLSDPSTSGSNEANLILLDSPYKNGSQKLSLNTRPSSTPLALKPDSTSIIALPLTTAQRTKELEPYIEGGVLYLAVPSSNVIITKSAPNESSDSLGLAFFKGPVAKPFVIDLVAQGPVTIKPGGKFDSSFTESLDSLTFSKGSIEIPHQIVRDIPARSHSISGSPFTFKGPEGKAADEKTVDFIDDLAAKFQTTKGVDPTSATAISDINLRQNIAIGLNTMTQTFDAPTLEHLYQAYKIKPGMGGGGDIGQVTTHLDYSFVGDDMIIKSYQLSTLRRFNSDGEPEMERAFLSVRESRYPIGQARPADLTPARTLFSEDFTLSGDTRFNVITNSRNGTQTLAFNQPVNFTLDGKRVLVEQIDGKFKFTEIDVPSVWQTMGNFFTWRRAPSEPTKVTVQIEGAAEVLPPVTASGSTIKRDPSPITVTVNFDSELAQTGLLQTSPGG